MPKHIVRLLALIVVVATVVFSAKKFLTPDSFYQYGHYRGDAVAEIAAKVPKLQGSASCQPCHKKAYAEWTAGIHRKATRNNAIQGHDQNKRPASAGLCCMSRSTLFLAQDPRHHGFDTCIAD
jgi:hypothetical protein